MMIIYGPDVEHVKWWHWDWTRNTAPPCHLQQPQEFFSDPHSGEAGILDFSVERALGGISLKPGWNLSIIFKHEE